jgi:hypothetical protein
VKQEVAVGVKARTLRLKQIGWVNDSVLVGVGYAA